MNSTPEERSAQFGMAAILGTPGTQALTQAVQLHGRMRPLIEDPARKVLTTPIGATSLYLFYTLKREHTQTVRKATINVLSFGTCAALMHLLEQSQQK